MTAEINPFEEETLYRYLPLIKEDKEDLENFSAWSDSRNIDAARNYIDSIAHRKDHRLLYMLRNKKLYRSTPSDFNDPYDCLVEISDNATNENLLNWLRLYYGNQALNSKEWNQRANYLSKYINDNNIELDNKHREPLLDLIKSTLQRIVNNSRIICFSKSQKNLLMWAHYADKHSGYCLSFDAKKLKGRNSLVGLYEVDCNSKLRPLLQLTPQEKTAEKILLKKSLHWKYEEEVRLIYVNTEEYFDFQPKSLTGIVFGAKMPPEYQAGFRFLVETLNEWKHASFSSAELDRKKYAVSIL